MKSKTKLKILRILFVISLIISILFISTTYAKYYEQLDTNYNIGIKRWNIIVNNESINNAINTGKKLSEFVKPTFEGNEYIAENVLVPDAIGYFDMNIDYSQVDIPFTFDISLDRLKGESHEDFELYAYSIQENVDSVSTDIMYYEIPEEYQQVEYIKSDGTAYINLGTKEDWTNKQEVKYYVIENEEGTIINELIPCYRVSDSVIGVYDLVTTNFYSNAGSGKFETGEVLNIKDLVIDPNNKDDLDYEDKIKNVKVYVRWNDNKSNQYNNVEDVYWSKIADTLDYKITVSFEQYIEE